MRTLGTLVRAVDTIEAVLVAPKYQIDKFILTLDMPGLFDPFDLEAITSTNFYDKEAPHQEGFTYVSEEYSDYIDTLIEEDSDHPFNKEHLPWSHIAHLEKQHHTAPDLEEIETPIVDTQQAHTPRLNR